MRAAGFGLVLTCSSCAPAWSQEAAVLPAANGITIYEPSFFTTGQPFSAFDMLRFLPGFSFVEQDTDLRGSRGASGNVLIDGHRVSTKSESLETILRRVPARLVSRIELIRPGAHGIDMQQEPVLANIVRLSELRSRGFLELDAGVYERDLSAGQLVVELERKGERAAWNLSAELARTIEDEAGSGRQVIASASELLSDARLLREEHADAADVSAGYEGRLVNGTLRVNAAVRDERVRGDIREQQRYPDARTEFVAEEERERSSELRLNFERAVANDLRLELLASHRRVREEERERSTAGATSELFVQDSMALESIVRGLARSSSPRRTLEAGIEGALNVLDSRSDLTEDGVEIALPADRVRVQEQRGETFATATWRIDSAWTLETGARLEASRLEQEGVLGSSRSFLYLKPRVLVSFVRRPGQVWRMLVERDVGQLDFEDFVTSSSLSSDTITAGNPALEPDRTWRAELAWERSMLASGGVLLAARYERITDLVDRLAIGTPPLDGVGNIGEGERRELEAQLNMPLHGMGMSDSHLEINVLWRDSRTRDPTTGRQRRISEDAPLEGALHFTQTLTARASWGIDVEYETRMDEFRFDEIRTETFGTRVDMFAEYELLRGWRLRLDANNLTDRRYDIERKSYGGPRSRAPLDETERRSLRIGRYLHLSLRRQFN